MITDVERWRLVARGLDLKIAALCIFVSLPLLGLVLWLGRLDLRWLLLVVVAAALPDALGRCMCLSAPIARKSAILASVVCQLFAFSAVIAFGFGGTSFELGIGLGTAGCFQAAAAVCFTRFLRNVANRLGRPDLVARADALSWMLVSSMLVSVEVAGAALVLLVVLAVVMVLTLGYGLYVAGPIAGIILLILSGVTGIVLMVMYWIYGSAMTRLRNAILEQIGMRTTREMHSSRRNGT